MSGRNGLAWPKEIQCPSSQVTASPACARARRNSSTRRDLPIPASPAMPTTCPRPALTSPNRSRSVASSRSEEHTSELQSPCNLVCRLLLEKKKKKKIHTPPDIDSSYE